MTDRLPAFIKAMQAVPPREITVKFAREFLRVQAIKLGISQHEVLRTVAFFEMTMFTQISLFFRDEINVFQFWDRMFELIGDQYRRAFNEGLRSVGWTDPLNEAMTGALRKRTEDEWEQLLDFAGEIEQARANDQSSAPFLSRVSLWANRYNELVTLGALMGGTRTDAYEWELGATEEHCATCSALNGIVATKDQWLASGYKPQNAPNDQLECGGWRCDCKLTPTKKPLTEGGIPANLLERELGVEFGEPG